MGYFCDSRTEHQAQSCRTRHVEVRSHHRRRVRHRRCTCARNGQTGLPGDRLRSTDVHAARSCRGFAKYFDLHFRRNIGRRPSGTGAGPVPLACPTRPFSWRRLFSTWQAKRSFILRLAKFLRHKRDGQMGLVKQVRGPSGWGPHLVCWIRLGTQYSCWSCGLLYCASSLGNPASRPAGRVGRT